MSIGAISAGANHVVDLAGSLITKTLAQLQASQASGPAPAQPLPGGKGQNIDLKV